MNVPILTKILNELTPYPLQGRFLKQLKKLNTQHVTRPALDPALKKRLQVEFEPEVQRLAELLGRDLSSWSSL